MRPEPTRRMGLLLVALTLAAGCTGGAEPDEPPADGGPGIGSLRGRLLLATGSGLGSGAETLELPGSRTAPIEGLEGGFLVDGAWGPDGRAVVAETYAEGAGQVYVAGPGEPLRPVGPRLAALSRVLGLSGDLAVVATCDGHGGATWILDLADPEAGWHRRSPGGCWATLSPDATTIAFPGDGVLDPTTVWRAPVSGAGPPEPLVRLSELEEGLLPTGVTSPEVSDLAWGDGGIALQVVDRDSEGGFGGGRFDHVALIVVGERRTTVVPLTNSYTEAMAWQPGGDLLAFIDCIECFEFRAIEPHGEIRLLDPATGELRQVAAAHEFFTGLAWSPDGSTLVSRWREGELMFVSVDGREVARLTIDAMPWDWGPA